MKTKFHTFLINPDSHVSYPDHWSLDLLIDCDLAVHILLQAYQNQGRCRKEHSSVGANDWLNS
jgi:hypothetical protein